jgi:oxidase EvaA
MQAKVEPGNVDGVQLTPTVQATRSNYTQVHQGARPPYVDYFLNRPHASVLVDSLQPEQGAAFLGKRNRNIIVEVDDDVPVGEEHRWMTLGQVKRLLCVPNLVSMDARTVLSCIPYIDPLASALAIKATGRPGARARGDAPAASDFGCALLTSFAEVGAAIHSDQQVVGWLTDLKCRHHLRIERIGLDQVRGWRRGSSSIVHEGGSFFEVVAVRVQAGNREVTAWDQPLVKAVEKGLVAFIVKEIDGILHVLVQGRIEPGNLDVVIVGPTVQCALGAEMVGDATTWPPFAERVIHASPGDVRYSCVQSEEGGRFYHVENEYRVVQLTPDENPELPENYLWLSLRQLGDLLRYGLVNVEARSLLACLQLAA